NPWEVFNLHGADATRWNMYTASPPGNSRRFSVNLVGETVRKFLNTIWNTYSFFVTYANLSDFSLASHPEGTSSAAEKSLLDRWVLSELNKLVRDVTEAYESYDVLGATRPVAEFVDSVSNWYVRLSRRRFWDGDAAALGTLYEVLTTVSQLIAPATPFIADELYQNLVRNVMPAAPESVHLSRWPAANSALIDEQLSIDMALAQRVTSLGHAARQNANLKVRQPLAQVVVRTRSAEEKASLDRLANLVLDELNVKGIAYADAAGDLVDVEVFPFPKQLGQKYGKGYPVIRKLISGMDQLELAGKLQAGENVTLEADGASYEIAPEDVEVRSTPRAGFSVAQDGGYLVAVTTELTPELEQEGNARELVRRIQQLRKDAGLEISDRITLYVSDSPVASDLLAKYGDYVQEETLTTNLVQNGVPGEVAQVAFALGDVEVTVGLVKA
ncbi:MAG: class I tRNA ligase family protein, partial [Caldilineaceae bacterium]|nr:class I tRNA ligase family protein [Caldilineaceae bacterium]